MGFFDFLTEEIAIDLGTANTLIIHNDKVVIDSPSIVARDWSSGKIIAVGKEANLMQGKTHQNIKTIIVPKRSLIVNLYMSRNNLSFPNAITDIEQVYRFLIGDLLGPIIVVIFLAMLLIPVLRQEKS